jgi:transcriptional regulator with XRE-family HTH domain
MLLPTQIEGAGADAKENEAVAEERFRAVVGFIFDGMQSAGTAEFLSRNFEKAVLMLAGREDEIPRDYAGAKFDNLRKEAGMTQDELAEVSGKSQSATIKFLSGNATPSLSDAANILSEIDYRLRQKTGRSMSQGDVVELLVQLQVERFEKNSKREPSESEVQGFEEQALRQYSKLFAK